MSQRLQDVKNCRPYPRDWRRKQRVMDLLFRHQMTISGLARELRVDQGTLSKVIWGTRKSPVMETRIAEYFSLTREQLFPRNEFKRGRNAA